MKIIDAKGLVLGRLSTFVAKQLLLGNEVQIVNCEQAVITGKKSNILQKHKQRRERGQPTQGPFISRLPDRFVKRTIRGMLPYKKSKGKEALKRLKCHIAVPETIKGAETIENPKLSNTNAFKHMTVKDLCKELGAKV